MVACCFAFGSAVQHFLTKPHQRCRCSVDAACILQGLDAMHQQTIVYRDLKPENVMLDEGGYCKIVDYGLAKKTLRTYTVCGTPEKMIFF